MPDKVRVEIGFIIGILILACFIGGLIIVNTGGVV